MEGTNFQTFEFVTMSKKITEKEIEDFLTSKSIGFTKIEFIDFDNETRNIKVTIKSNAMTLTELELLKGQSFPKHKDQIIRIQFTGDGDGLIAYSQPEEDQEIEYAIEYDKLLMKEYTRKLGSDGVVFNNQTVIDKQRSVAGYLIKNIGLNLIKGKSIMNVSLPINIFDTRSILELFAWQNAYASTILEEGGLANNPLEKIKFTTAFALTKFHLSGAQLKPFNPILGETFQCKILDSNFYTEQISHHPPVMSFYGFGKNYKIYGYNESEASTGANSVKVYYKGNFIVEYPDGTKHKIIYPTLKLEGTMVGSRALKFRGKLLVLDMKNDIISQINLDPDERGFMSKLFSKKTTYPDYFKGVVTIISKNTEKDKDSKKNKDDLKVKSIDKHVLSHSEGEFTNYLKFDGKVYWQYDSEAFPKFRRMGYTLPSDSTFRADLIWLKKGDEDAAQRYKVKLEEIQRKEKKLREKETKTVTKK